MEDNGIGVEPSTALYNILTLPETSDFYQHPMGVVIVAENEEICEQRRLDPTASYP